MQKIANIDTIYILVDIENYENMSNKLLNHLYEEKEIAKARLTDNSTYVHMININNMVFQIKPSGAPGYLYILQNNGFEVKIAQARSKLDAFYPIQIRISSEYLWTYGLNTCWSIIYNWVSETFGNIIDDKIYRIDLCCHISDVDFITDYDISYKGHYKKTQIFNTGRTVNCLKFGSRNSKNIYCRIYNKTLEIREKKHKTWFNDIWTSSNLNIDNVWNVEFEIKSEFLRKFNINSMNDIYNHLGDLWEYCTKEFVVKIDRINNKVERCPINHDWLEIQNAYSNFISSGLIERNKQVQLDAKVLIPSITGFITSYSARKGNKNLSTAFNSIYKDMQRYLKQKNTNFENEVNYKSSLLTDKGGKK